MRNQKTVLVLGAGASHGFGLPLGNELKQQIATDLNIKFDDFGHSLGSGSHEIVDALRLLVRDENGHNGDINPHRASAVSIARAMSLSGSIDEFVERHRDDSKVAECAKLGIAKAILEAERRSTIYGDHRNTRDDLIGDGSDSWLAHMLRILTARLNNQQLISAFTNLHIINFNYDRCFENFVFLWFQQVYGLDEATAAQISNSIQVYHPFGKLGDLPFQDPSSHIAFGGEIDSQRLILIASRIRTYSEAVNEDSELRAAREALGRADKIVYLGFAFHEQNMDLLQIPSEFERSTIRAYATTQGISAPRLGIDKQRVSSSFRLQSASNLFFEGVDGDCEKFWTEYGDVVVQ